jgi:hypothetical protein
MAYPYGPPNVGGKLLRTSSIENLDSLIAGNQASIQTNEADLLTITDGGAETNSLAKLQADTKAYTDSLVSGVNLSAVIANRDALLVLNGADGAVGSVATSVSTALDSTTLRAPLTALNVPVTNNTTSITDISCGSDGDVTSCGTNSVYKQITDLRDGVNEIYDTVVEVANGTLENDTDLDDITTAASDSVTYIDGLLSAQTTTQNNAWTSFDTDKIPAHVTGMTSDVDTALTNQATAMDLKYLQTTNLFSEITMPDDTFGIEENLYLPVSANLSTMIGNFTDDYFLEDIEVVDGIITMGTVPIQNIKWIRLNFFGDAYDTIQIIPGTNPGEYKVYDQIEGDLNGQTVEARWVKTQKALVPRDEVFNNYTHA